MLPPQVFPRASVDGLRWIRRSRIAPDDATGPGQCLWRKQTGEVKTRMRRAGAYCDFAHLMGVLSLWREFCDHAVWGQRARHAGVVADQIGLACSFIAQACVTIVKSLEKFKIRKLTIFQRTLIASVGPTLPPPFCGQWFCCCQTISRRPPTARNAPANSRLDCLTGAGLWDCELDWHAGLNRVLTQLDFKKHYHDERHIRKDAQV
jgi:hypothetical protein